MSSTLAPHPARPAAPPASPLLTPSQYFALDSVALRRSEFVDGRMIEMAGASLNHITVASNVFQDLKNQLEDRDCGVFASDCRVRADKRYYYPDVCVVCDAYIVDILNLDTLTNPSVLIEVLSPSTESVDRGRKLRDYRRTPSLRAYLLVEQDYPLVEQYERGDDGGWRLVETEGLDGIVELPAIGCRLEMARIYRRVSLSEPETAPTDEINAV